MTMQERYNLRIAADSQTAPSKPPTAPQGAKHITFRVTPELHEKAVHNAKERGWSLSDYIRQTILKDYAESLTKRSD